jgi:hypothetical protein
MSDGIFEDDLAHGAGFLSKGDFTMPG